MSCHFKAPLLTFQKDIGRKLPLDTLDPSPEQIREQKDLVAVKSKLETEIKDLKMVKKKFRGKDKANVSKRLDKLECQSECIRVLDEHLVMKVRNQKVTRGLQAKYKDSTNDHIPLRVYCVSNLHYNWHLEGFSLSRIPCPVELTGIPALRLCAMTLSSKDNFEETWQRWRIRVPEIVLKTAGWCKQSVMVRRNDLRQKIRQQLEVRFHLHWKSMELSVSRRQTE